jgi:SH3-like domain-containing protein
VSNLFNLVNLRLTALNSDKRLFTFTTIIAIFEFAHMRCLIASFAAAFSLIPGLAMMIATPAQAAGEEADTAPTLRLDTPSGFPVPRFVSLKTKKTYCRSGPSFSHPIRITFMRKGLPVMVVAETNDHWRKIRDQEGDECWTHKSKLSGVKTALVKRDGLELHARPDSSAPVRARLGRGLIAHIENKRGQWVWISAQGVKGWAPQSGLWGPTNAAPQN